MINIDELIKSAMKNRQTNELKAYKNLKAKIMEFKTAKDAKVYDESAELQIIKKMCQQLIDSEIIYSKANRQDLYDECRIERGILEGFLPKAASAEEIESVVLESSFMVDGHIEKKNMGAVIKEVKSKFTFVDGALVANIVKSFCI